MLLVLFELDASGFRASRFDLVADMTNLQLYAHGDLESVCNQVALAYWTSVERCCRCDMGCDATIGNRRWLHGKSQS